MSYIVFKDETDHRFDSSGDDSSDTDEIFNSIYCDEVISDPDDPKPAKEFNDDEEDDDRKHEVVGANDVYVNVDIDDSSKLEFTFSDLLIQDDKGQDTLFSFIPGKKKLTEDEQRREKQQRRERRRRRENQRWYDGLRKIDPSKLPVNLQFYDIIEPVPLSKEELAKLDDVEPAKSP